MISNSTLDIIPFFVMRKKKAANQKLDFIKLKYSNQFSAKGNQLNL